MKPALKPEERELVERLHAQLASDHIRGCMGRQYSCTCGYDAETEKLLAEAADALARTDDEGES